MPRTCVIFLLAALAVLPAACSAPRRSLAPAAGAPTSQITIGPSTRPAADPKAELALNQIEPKLTPPATQPSTRPAAPPPPLEALELYARARDALASRHHATAISSLEAALKLDPDSAELHRTIARAYMAGQYPERAIESLRRATELDPSDVRSHTTLGRLFLMRNDPDAALTHLRLAVLTEQYKTDEAAAAVADYFLARALQQLGYDRAAVDQYEKLLERLSRPSLALRNDPEISDWAERPASIFGHVARLYEKRGERQKALAAWRVIADEEPADVDARSRVVDLLLTTGQRDEALREAADLVRRNNASSQSLHVLREVGRKTGDPDAVYRELRRLLAEQKDDRTLLFALVDLLSGEGRDAEAESLLVAAAREGWDEQLIGRLIDFYTARHRAADAAKLLIEASAARPVTTPMRLERYRVLLQPMRRDALRADDVLRIEVAPEARAAKEFFVALTAEANGRALLARESFDRAVAIDPPFPPAYRAFIRNLGSRGDVPKEQRDRNAAALIDRARQSGLPSLADEMLAYQAFGIGDRPAAIDAFERAVKANGASPDSVLALAELYLDSGNPAKFQQTCWRAISDYPTFDAVYRRLFSEHLRGGGLRPARNVIQQWVRANPSNVEARTTDAHVAALAGEVAEGMRVLAELVRQYPADPLPLNSAEAVYRDAGQTPQLIEMVEELFARSPDSVNLAMHLAQHYASLHRRDDALRVADRLKQAAQGDARLMFLAGQVYSLIEQKEQHEALMVEAQRLDPNDAGIANDLGYTWADAGKNLDRAESMIRVAVEAEPDNASYLDSLGWVLYKRGRLEEARKYLEQSVAADPTIEPVVLDHLGDTLYRLHDSDGAQMQWQKSLQRVSMLGEGRRDLDALRRTLAMKLQQAQAGQPVTVAPLAADVQARPAGQAKN